MTARDESETILPLVGRLRRQARLVMRWLCLAVVALMAVVGPVAAAPPQNFVLRDAPVSVPELVPLTAPHA